MNAEVSPEIQSGNTSVAQKPETGSRVCSSPFPIFQCNRTIYSGARTRLELHLHLLLLFLCHVLPPPVAASGRILHPRVGYLLRQGTVIRRYTRDFPGSG